MKKLLTILFTLTLASCADGVYYLMYRTTNLPFEQRPKVISFAGIKQLTVSWDYDEGADLYLLYRDTSPTGDFTDKIYEGKALSYTDSGLTNETWYYYRLVKKRGKELFSNSFYGYGVANTIPQDLHENNDIKEKATIFYDTIYANIFYYQDSAGNVVSDTDWYKVFVLAGRSETIEFQNFSNIADQGIAYTSEIGPRIPLNQGDSITIPNSTDTDQFFYFNITPDNGLFFDPSSGGGKIGNYQINFVATQGS